MDKLIDRIDNFVAKQQVKQPLIPRMIEVHPEGKQPYTQKRMVKPETVGATVAGQRIISPLKDIDGSIKEVVNVMAHERYKTAGKPNFSATQREYLRDELGKLDSFMLQAAKAMGKEWREKGIKPSSESVPETALSRARGRIKDLIKRSHYGDNFPLKLSPENLQIEMQKIDFDYRDAIQRYENVTGKTIAKSKFIQQETNNLNLSPETVVGGMGDKVEAKQVVGYGQPSYETERAGMASRDLKDRIEKFLAKSKVYLREGEKAPKDAQIMQGKRGGRFYDSGVLSGRKHEVPKWASSSIRHAFKVVPRKHITGVTFVGFSANEEKSLTSSDSSIMAQYRGSGNIHLSSKLFSMNDSYLKMRCGYYIDAPVRAATMAVIHEIGHKVHEMNLSSVIISEVNTIDIDSPGKGVTEYAKMAGTSERFAEAYAYYLVKPELVKRRDPYMFDILEKIFETEEGNK